MPDRNPSHAADSYSQSREPAEAADAIAEVAAARRYGIDIEMLKANLARPVSERIRRHQIALKLFRALHNRGRPS